MSSDSVKSLSSSSRSDLRDPCVLSDGYAGTEGYSDQTGWEYGSSPQGTSSKNGTLKPDIPVDGCQFGNIDDLRVESFGF